MSIITVVQPNTEIVFSPQHVREARAIAAQTKRSVAEVLEDRGGLDPRGFVMVLGELLHLPVYAMDDIDQLLPAFEVLPFFDSAERDCIALRNGDNGLIVLMSDPFNVALQTWMEQRISIEFTWGLAHRSDIAAYLSHHEKSLNAMDSMQDVGHKTATEDGQILEDLSFKTISEESSLIVKLVHSTVYDALKAEASDIHLETTPNGLTIKYRLDGALVTVSALGVPSTE